MENLLSLQFLINRKYTLHTLIWVWSNSSFIYIL
nr:MAG TPA: hypothetical protein [Caudoviricetes sp.]